MQLEISVQAGNDIDALFLYGLMNFGEGAASDYSDGLFDLFELILANPEIGRKLLEMKRHPRMISYRSHAVFYHVKPRSVRVLRVLHGRQNWFDHL
jgi:toxin ParE1/3/4